MITRLIPILITIVIEIAALAVFLARIIHEHHYEQLRVVQVGI
jgi:hypothetical protein